MLDLLKPRVKNLDQLVDELRPFLVDQPEIDPAAAAKHLTPEIRPLLAQLATTLDAWSRSIARRVEQALRARRGAGRREGRGA